MSVLSRNFLLLVLCLVFCNTYAQESKLWTSVNLEYRPNTKWHFSLEEQLRLKKNSSVTDQYFTALDLSYSVLKNIELAMGYRYITKKDNTGNIQGSENYSRVHFDLSYKYKSNNFSFKHRFRFQNKKLLSIDGLYHLNDKVILVPDYKNKNIRFKTSIAYNIKNWPLDPKLSAEIFYHLEEGDTEALDLEEKTIGFNKYRITLATDYKMNGYGKIGGYYRLENEFNVNAPSYSKIIGVKYSYVFKNKKNSQKSY